MKRQTVLQGFLGIISGLFLFYGSIAQAYEVKLYRMPPTHTISPSYDSGGCNYLPDEYEIELEYVNDLPASMSISYYEVFCDKGKFIQVNKKTILSIDDMDYKSKFRSHLINEKWNPQNQI